MIIQRRSPITGKINEMDLNITEEEYSQWVNGKLIQNAFPNLTPEEREFIVTGLTPDEWNDIFGEEGEE